MSDATFNINTAHGVETLYLRPEEILIDPAYDVRPYSANHPELEQVLIEQLATSIKEEGQLDPVNVLPRRTKDGGEEYVVYAGHRRRRAYILINQHISETTGGTGELKKIWCVVDRRSGDPRKKAFRSNNDREDPSPMDNVLFAMKLKEELGGTNSAVAKYLGVSKGEVGQWMKLIGPHCSQYLRNQIHEGVVSLDSALAIIAEEEKKAATAPKKEEPRTEGAGKAEGKAEVEDGSSKPTSPADRQAGVLKRAREIQTTAAAEKISNRKDLTPAQKKEAMKKAQADKRIKSPAVRKALSEQTGKQRRNMSDVKEWFDEVAESPTYAQPVRDWAAFMRDKWIAGEGERKSVQMFDLFAPEPDKKKEAPKQDPKQAAPIKSAAPTKGKSEKAGKDGKGSK